MIREFSGKNPGNSRKCLGNFQKMSKRFPGKIRKISGKFPRNFLEISWTFPGHFRENLRKIPQKIHEISGKCPGKFPDSTQSGGLRPPHFYFWIFCWKSAFWARYEGPEGPQLDVLQFSPKSDHWKHQKPGKFREIPSNFQEKSRKFPGNVQEISRKFKFPRNFQEISRKFPRNVLDMSGKCPERIGAETKMSATCQTNVQEMSWNILDPI